MTTFRTSPDDSIGQLPQARRWVVAASTALALLAFGCGSDSGDSNDPVLDPSKPHYGYTHDEWQVRWWQWLYEQPQDEDNCVRLFEDPTGEHCDYRQSGEVFFLIGTSTGVAVRNECRIPAGKAIFFPILNVAYDNAGVTEGQQLSADGLKEAVQQVLDALPTESLVVEFDGKPVPNLERFRTEVTEFSYELPPEPNLFTCLGATGVEGVVEPVYAAGYHVMLAPPEKGEHTLRFAGNWPQTIHAANVDVTYNFRVE